MWGGTGRVKWKQFFSFWNVNAPRFAEYLWRNHVIKNQVSLCSHHWYGVHNLKWNIFLPLAISSPFSLLSKWRAGFVWKGHMAFMELTLTCWQANVITFLWLFLHAFMAKASPCAALFSIFAQYVNYMLHAMKCIIMLKRVNRALHLGIQRNTDFFFL